MDQKVIKSNILLPLIEESYRQEYSEYARRNLRCSDAGAAADGGEKCEREIYYDMKFPDKKTPLTSGSLVLFDDGRLHESDIRRRLRTVLRSPEKELFDDELSCRGKIDNKVYIKSCGDQLGEGMPDPEFMRDGKDPILELKSVNEYSYQEMAAKGVIPQSYYDQVQYYLYLEGLRWAIILIKNRNSNGHEKGALPFLEFVILADPERQALIRGGLRTTKDCVDNSIMPPRPFLRESTKCSYCRFKRECWGPEKEAPVMEVSAEPVERPSQEILEGAMRLCAQLAGQMKDLEAQQSEAKSVIETYFKATKEKELIVGNIKASYSVFNKTVLDKNALLHLIGKDLYIEVSQPVRKEVEKAVEDRKIDAGVIDQSLKNVGTSATLRVNELKEKSGRLTKEQIEKQKEVAVEDKKAKRTRKKGNKKNKPRGKARVAKA
jgi:hypothetical protein